MTKFERVAFVLGMVGLLLMIIGLLRIVAPVHAEGSTFIDILRRAGQHGVFIVVQGDASTWMTITDIGQDYVCGTHPDSHRVWCTSFDKIESVTIDNADSLPAYQ